jgi:hypothetical protein
MAAMVRRPSGFNPRRYARSQEARLVLGFFLLLYVVGGGLIAWFYGLRAMALGLACITGGLLLFLALYGLVALIGWWAGE